MSGITVHWLSLGELSRLIEVFHKEGVREGRDGRAGEAQADFFQHPARLAAGQAAAEPAHALTDMLLGAVAKVLGDEGIELISSTAFLEPLLARRAC
jgi:UDP-2,3-diacylglucosamine hydrolase